MFCHSITACGLVQIFEDKRSGDFGDENCLVPLNCQFLVGAVSQSYITP